MNYRAIKRVLDIEGFSEFAIGLFESKLYNVLFDCNSGGLSVLDLDENSIDGVCEDASDLDFIGLIAKHVNPNNRADLPF